jgi:recombination associated protein RdgC
MIKSFTLFRIHPSWRTPGADALADALSRFVFLPCGPTEPRKAGWVAPRGIEHAALVESIGGHLLMRLQVETRLLPASAVRDRLEEELDAIESRTGRRPRGKARRELREQVEHTLLPQAFTRRATTLVWIDPQARRLLIGTGTAGATDAVLAELSESFGTHLPLSRMDTRISPASAMAAWLMEGEAPAGFSIDRDCELRQPDADRATVRYARHPLDDAEITRHIQQGKLPVQLALTWADRVSFVLTDELRVKRLAFLDHDSPSAGAGSRVAGADEEDDPFDADAVLLTGELSRMIAALIEALGGESDPAEDSASVAGQPRRPAGLS